MLPLGMRERMPVTSSGPEGPAAPGSALFVWGNPRLSPLPRRTTQR
jgi:hypothetical protein